MSRIIINGSFLAQPRTGVQRFAIEISKALRSVQPDITVVVPGDAQESEVWQDLHPVRIGHLSGHLWEQIELPLYARRHKALLLNLDMRGPLLYPNKLITIHDLNFVANPQWVSRRFYWAYRFLVKAGASTSRKVLTVSEFSKQEIIRFLGLPSAKIAVVYNAVSDRVKQANYSGKRVVSASYILSVASTDPRKNLPRLISAFSQLPDRNIKLVLAGLAHKKDAILEDVENVVFLGHIDDATLVNLYQHARAFVYPSLYEGFGIPPLEAMYHGCPVVTSNTTSLPEICGDAALYVDPEDTASITRGIQAVLTDNTLRNALISQGKQRFEQFDWNHSARKLLHILKDLLTHYH